MSKEFVMFRGVEMIPSVVERMPSWLNKIREAQLITTINIDGVELPRIKYGDENNHWKGCSSRPCHDCSVISGEYHVPGCDVESCPKCERQLISCHCVDEDEDENV